MSFKRSFREASSKPARGPKNGENERNSFAERNQRFRTRGRKSLKSLGHEMRDFARLFVFNGLATIFFRVLAARALSRFKKPGPSLRSGNRDGSSARRRLGTRLGTGFRLVATRAIKRLLFCLTEIVSTHFRFVKPLAAATETARRKDRASPMAYRKLHSPG
jgi:hypothetical protein